MTKITTYKNQLTEIISRYRNHVDFLAIRVEYSEETNIILRGNQIDTLSEGIASGGQVRACYRGGWGFATFNEIINSKPASGRGNRSSTFGGG